MGSDRRCQGVIDDALEVLGPQVSDQDLGDHRKHEPAAVRRLLFPMALGPAGPAGRAAAAVEVVLDQRLASGSKVRCWGAYVQTLGQLDRLGQRLISRACRGVSSPAEFQPPEPPVATWFGGSVGDYPAFEWDDLASGIVGDAQVRDLLSHDLVESLCERVWGTIWGKTPALQGEAPKPQVTGLR